MFRLLVLTQYRNMMDRHTDERTPQYYPEIICITESWLYCNIPNIAVNLDGYHLIRKDRSSGPGGGVAVYISNLL